MKNNNDVAIISVFMSNLPLEIAHYQGLVVQQYMTANSDHIQLLTRRTHAEQLDQCLRTLTHDIFILLDIDAI